MKITDNMDLDQLAERMGEATEAEARHLRAALVGLGAWSTTEEISEDQWLKLCEEAVLQAKHDET